jgi:beta-carotene/zeaxanthin 4-ketolase
MSPAPPLDPAKQARIGLMLAAAIIGAWLMLHVGAVFLWRPSGLEWLWALPLIVLQTWLSVGLFIVAHDAMHGSLAPGRQGVNRGVGRLALLLYAGFWMDRLAPRHFDHHRHVGTERDPDFHADEPTRAVPWFAQFMRRYFGWREFVVMAAISWTYLLLAKVPLANLLLLWALPAILSSVQLFYFGTFLPHRHEAAPFADRHNARSNDFPAIVSLLTCFHFGYHREHHLQPGTPWWRLPAERRRMSLHNR